MIIASPDMLVVCLIKLLLSYSSGSHDAGGGISEYLQRKSKTVEGRKLWFFSLEDIASCFTETLALLSLSFSITFLGEAVHLK